MVAVMGAKRFMLPPPSGDPQRDRFQREVKRELEATPATTKASSRRYAYPNGVLHWPFDDEGGAGHQNAGTGGVLTLTPSGTSVVRLPDECSLLGTGCTQRGVTGTDHLVASGGVQVGTTRFRGSIWVSPRTFNANGSVFFGRQYDNTYGVNPLTFGLGFDNVGRPQSYMRTSGGYNVVTGVQALPIAVWSHMAVSWDGTTHRLYLNGLELANTAQSGTMSYSAAGKYFCFKPPDSATNFSLDGMLEDALIEDQLEDQVLKFSEITTGGIGDNILRARYLRGIRGVV